MSQKAAVYLKSLSPLFVWGIVIDGGLEHEYPVVQERAIPKPKGSDALLKVTSVGLNPIDCTSLLYGSGLIIRQNNRVRPLRRATQNPGN